MNENQKQKKNDSTIFSEEKQHTHRVNDKNKLAEQSNQNNYTRIVVGGSTLSNLYECGDVSKITLYTQSAKDIRTQTAPRRTLHFAFF